MTVRFLYYTGLENVFIFSPENVAGKLVFYQMEGSIIYVRDTGELASDVPTEAMFELLDPQKNLSSAEFSYTWDLGNGLVEIQTFRGFLLWFLIIIIFLSSFL